MGILISLHIRTLPPVKQMAWPPAHTVEMEFGHAGNRNVQLVPFVTLCKDRVLKANNKTAGKECKHGGTEKEEG